MFDIDTSLKTYVATLDGSTILPDGVDDRGEFWVIKDAVDIGLNGLILRVDKDCGRLIVEAQNAIQK